MDALTEYANNGGTILAFGQDLSSVVGRGSTAFFYGTRSARLPPGQTSTAARYSPTAAAPDRRA
jgi:hypothetical protein